MNAQHAADNVLIDLHTKSQRDLLSNAGTTPAGVTPFHCHYGLDEVFVGSLRARPTAAPRRKQHGGTLVGAAHCGDAAEWKASERWRNEQHVPSAGTGCPSRR